MNTEYLESIPDELVCQIISNITKMEDVIVLLNLSPRINYITKSCITRLYGYHIPVEFSFVFPNLTSIGNVYINNAGELSYLASLPKLKSAIIDNDAVGILDEDFVAYVPNIFLGLYANTYSNINGKIVRINRILDDTHFYLSGSYTAIIHGNQFKSHNNTSGVLLAFSSEERLDEESLNQITNFIVNIYSIQNSNNSSVTSILLPFDRLSQRLCDMIYTYSRKGRIPIATQTIYEIVGTDLLTGMMRIVRKLRLYLYEFLGPIDITERMQGLKYKNLEYLDGPFYVGSFLNEIDHRVNFPNLKTMGFYVYDLDNLEFLQVLNPTIQTVILYVHDTSPILPIQSSINIIVRRLSEAMYSNIDYIFNSYVGLQ